MMVVAMLALWGVYLFTMAPTVYVGDSGELTTAAYLLGIPHPPGYPWFTWWGHLGSLVPIGNIAYRINVATGAAGLAVAWTMGTLAARLTRSAWQGAIVAWAAGCAPLLWGQSTAAEVYAIAGMGWAMTARTWSRPPGTRWMLLALLAGLCVTLHPVAVLGLPVIAWEIWRDVAPGRRRLWWGWLAAGLPLAASLGLMLRALAYPTLAWGVTEHWQGLWEHFSRQQYGLAEGSRSWNVWLRQYADAAYLMKAQWGITMGFAAVGWLAVDSRWKRFALGISAIVVLGLPLLVNFGSDGLSRDLLSMFYFPLALPMAIGMAGLVERASQKGWGAGAAGLLAVLTGWQLAADWPVMDRSRTTIGYAYGRDVMAAADDGTVAFLEGDNVIFPLAYVRWVEGWPMEGRAYDETGNVLEPVYGSEFMRLPQPAHGRILAEVQAALMKAFPRTSFNVGTRLANFHDRPAGGRGLLLSSEPSFERPFWRRSRSLSAVSSDADYMARDLEALAWYFFGEAWLPVNRGRARSAHERASRLAWDNETLLANVGNAWLWRGTKGEAVWWYRRAVAAHPGNPANWYNVGYALAGEDRVNEAGEAYAAALEVEPRHTASWMGWGMMLLKQSPPDPGRALMAFERAVKLDPLNPQAHFNLGASLGNLQRFSEAREAFQRALQLDPSYDRARQALEQLRNVQ